ncbi:unnamed protein product [Boreogadus saida]
MTMLEKRPAALGTTEHIEMEIFASEESCAVVSVHDTEEGYFSYYRHLEHPLVSVSEEEYLEAQVQSPAEQQFKLKRVLSVGTEDLDDCPLIPDLKEDMEIEMEEFPPFNTPESEQVFKTSALPSFKTLRFPAVASLNQVTQVKWRQVDHQRTGLVVKDVICLPRGHLLAHPDRHGTPRGKEKAAMATMGLTARITIDCGWSTREMESRLVSHFHGRLGRRSSFAYLQEVSDWPERWTQAGLKRKDFPLGVAMERCGETQPVEGNLPPEHSHKIDLMCGQNAFLEDFDWRDVTDPEAQVRMKQLQSTTSLGLLSDSSCDRDRSSELPENDSTDHSSIYASLVKHYIYHRVASMAAQFTDGLDSCSGLWETVCTNWEAFAPVMIGMGQMT